MGRIQRYNGAGDGRNIRGDGCDCGSGCNNDMEWKVIAVLCPAKCGKKFTTQEFAEKHADAEHADWRIPKAKGWRTPYGFIDFFQPVTYEHACKEAKELRDNFNKEENNE